MAAATRKSGGGARPARKMRAARRDAKGTVDADGRRHAPFVEARGPAVSRATSCTTRCSIRATARRCSPPRAPGISDRRCFARPTAARTWKEAATPPAFERGQRAHRRPHVLAHAGPRDRSRASGMPGTSPQGLFRSTDGGVDLGGCRGFNEHPQRKAWCGGDQDGTPDGPKLHSILIDPRDAEAHVYRHVERRHLRVDRRRRRLAAAQPRRARRFPARSRSRIRSRSALRARCIRCNPTASISRTTAGIYRLDRPATRWTDIGAAMPKSVGSIGFPMVLHPRDPDTLWVFPMDGTDRLAARLARRQARRLSLASMAARPGSGRRRACRRRRRGGPSSGRR